MNNIESLQRLVDAVEKSGANVAPTYQEYMPMAFAIANSCGEEGRSSFHRLCRISEKYKSEEADKLYDHALQQGSGANSLGTVFHLAERTGIRLDRKLANLQNLQPPHPHTRTREERKSTYGAYNEAVFSMVGENGRKALRTKWFRHVRENGLNISKRFFSLHGLTSALRLRGFSADLRAIALHRACRWG